MRIAVVQLTSKQDPEKNTEKIRSLLNTIDLTNVKMVFLPEGFFSMTYVVGEKPTLFNVVTSQSQQVLQIAKDFNIYLVGGSVPVILDNESKLRNRALVISPEGKIIEHYDKINLFKINHPEKKMDEGERFVSGDQLKIAKIEEWKIGLSICFDLRFPELYRSYQKQNCDLMTIASAFTVPTGKAHWHTLVRARAIETQSYVVASAQWGEHEGKHQTFGHSLVIDPWGEVLLDLGEGEKIGVLEISKERIAEIRSRMVVTR